MDHRLYTSCMAGIFKVYHAGKNMAQMYSNNYRQLTLVFMLLAVMSQTLPLSFNISDFYRAPSGNDHFFSANTAVIKRASNH